MSSLKVASFVGSTQPTSAGRPAIGAFLGDAESEAIVREALADLTDNPNAIRRGEIGRAIEVLAQERSPQVLIVDISRAETPATEIHRLAEVCEPGVHVVAVGERNEIGLYRTLLQTGVADYIVKPLTRELVRRAVDVATGTVSVNPISQKLGKLIAVLGTRGGIGTTTIAVNLAWHLANRHARRVALLDLDLQTGDCAMMLDSKPTSGLREALENPYRIDERLLERTMTTHGENLFIMSAEESLRDELHFAPEAIQKLLSALQEKFHYVIVDVPRTPSAANQRVVDLATVRVVISDETIRSAREIVRLRGIFGEAGSGRQTLLVVNRSGERRPGFIPHGEFANAVEMQPVVEIPVQALGAGRAAIYGAPIAAGRGRVAEAIARLAGEVSGRHEAKRKWRLW